MPGVVHPPAVAAILLAVVPLSTTWIRSSITASNPVCSYRLMVSTAGDVALHPIRINSRELKPLNKPLT